MPVAAIIVAAGSGRRLGMGKPKALVSLAGAPMFEHSLKAFSRAAAVAYLVLVRPPKFTIDQTGLRRRYPKLCAVVPGGKERSDSVRAGLEAVPAGSDLVLVHDAARPLVSAKDITSVIRAARRHGAAVLAEPMTDTVKRVDQGFVRATLNRQLLWRAQTPQGFRMKIMKSICSRPSTGATDDSSLAEALGVRVAVVPATGINFKITNKTDLETAAWLLERRSGE